MNNEELCKRLRLLNEVDAFAAADRIEALVRERDGFYEEAMHHIELWGKALAENTKLEVRLAKAVEALRATTASIEHADMSDGVCCCGDNMDGHADPMSCGHSPTDMGEYYAHKAVEMARAVLAEIEGGKDE